ncbi:MAG: hypothetical protein WCD45_00900 [Gallionella sp.]
MKIRLFIFITAVLLLPAAGLFLSGAEWADLEARALGGDDAIINPPSTLLTTLMMFGYIIFVNHLNKLVTGNRPFKDQLPYLKRVGAAGAILCWLLAYLNLFVASWTTQPGNPLLQALLYTPLFALLAPAVLCTRAFISALPNVLKSMSSRHTFTPPTADKLAYTLIPLSALGLIGGAVWPTRLDLLLWTAPLLLLVTLQLLWHESTIFSGLKSGDYGRAICSALAGSIAGNFAIFAYHSNGGMLTLNSGFVRQFGMVLFGLACMQLADVIAENWRGKKRDEIFPKKKFPIPVVVKNK